MREIAAERPALAELVVTVVFAVGIAVALALVQGALSGIPLRPQIFVTPCGVGAAVGALLAVRSSRLRSMLREARNESRALRFSDSADAAGSRDGSLRAEIAARDLLLREMHHRTKNNLQLVCSLISRQIDDQDPTDSMMRLLGRVRTISLVHDQLYRQRDPSVVDLRTFLESVVTSVVRSLAPPTLAVIPELALDDIELRMPDAAPLGLIVNELVTNTIEHGFVGRTRGTLLLACTIADRDLRIRYEDDGVGMPDGPIERESAGLTLIGDLVRQMHGVFHVRSDGPGFAADLVVPHVRDDGGMQDRRDSATLTKGPTG